MNASFVKMLEEGCPECGSLDIYETTVSVNGEDGHAACVCDECGWTVLKLEPHPGNGDSPCVTG